MHKTGLRVFWICCGFIILAGIFMMLTNEGTDADINTRSGNYKGYYPGKWVLIAGLVMAISGWWIAKDIKKENKNK